MALPYIIQSAYVANVQVKDFGKISKVINISQFNKYNKLIRVSFRIIKVKTLKSLKGVFSNPTVNELQYAEDLWIKYVQTYLGNDWKIRYWRLGPSLITIGLIG